MKKSFLRIFLLLCPCGNVSVLIFKSIRDFNVKTENIDFDSMFNLHGTIDWAAESDAALFNVH